MNLKKSQDESRVFQVSVDKRTLTTTVFTQPSFYMGCFSMGMMMATQKFPEELLPAKYLSMRYNGVRVTAMLAMPFCVLGGLYFGVASIITTSPIPTAGHLLGYGLSLTTGLSMMALYKVSWYYPLLGCVYFAFGGFHHYRRLMVCADNAPLFYFSDFSDIRKYRKMRKEMKTVS